MSDIRTPTILLIDDNEDDYEATERSFKKANFISPFFWCNNGEDALDFLHRTGKYENDTSTFNPDLILLDLNMPGLDGRKLLKTIKCDQALKHIPIIVLTTSSDINDINQCYELGASTYIQKPVGFDNLVAAAQQIKNYWFGVALLPKVSSHD